MPISPLDVFFRATRNYIQGSLMIPQSIEKALELGAGSGTALIVRDAMFRQIIDHHIVASWGEPPSAEFGNPLGQISLVGRSGSPALAITLFRDPTRTGDPPRLGDTSKVIEPFELMPNGEAITSFKADRRGLEAFLRGVVELNKKAYELRFSNCSKIIFAGFFDSSIPVHDQAFADNGTLHFTPMTVRRETMKTSAVSRTVLTATDGTKISASVIFTFVESAE